MYYLMSCVYHEQYWLVTFKTVFKTINYNLFIIINDRNYIILIFSVLISSDKVVKHRTAMVIIK